MNGKEQTLAKQLDELVRRAIALHRDGKLKEADPLYRKYLAFRPDNASAWGLFAALLRSREHREPTTVSDERLDRVLRSLNRQ